MPDREAALRKYREGPARTVFDSAQSDFDRFRRQYIGKLALKPAEIVLDVGCGTGFSFSMLEDAVGPGGRIVGIEQSPEQLGRAQTLVERSGWHNITLINSPVEDAQIPVAADAALFSFTHDIMRTPRAVGNVVKSLKPAARIVVVGMKWAPWWSIAANWRNWRGARNYITTFEGFGRPWSHLAELVSSLQLESLTRPLPNMGDVSVYIAVARK